MVYKLSPLIFQLVKFPEPFMRVLWMQQNHSHRYMHDVNVTFKSYILKALPSKYIFFFFFFFPGNGA